MFWLDFGFEPFGAVRTALVKNDRHLCLCRELCVGSLYSASITLLGFDNEKDRIHKAGHWSGSTHISDGRHVENDVIEIPFLKVGHHFVESFCPWDLVNKEHLPLGRFSYSIDEAGCQRRGARVLRETRHCHQFRLVTHAI